MSASTNALILAALLDGNRVSISYGDIARILLSFGYKSQNIPPFVGADFKINIFQKGEKVYKIHNSGSSNILKRLTTEELQNLKEAVLEESKPFTDKVLVSGYNPEHSLYGTYNKLIEEGLVQGLRKKERYVFGTPSAQWLTCGYKGNTFRVERVGTSDTNRGIVVRKVLDTGLERFDTDQKYRLNVAWIDNW
ncbi:hypothetical protein AB4179_23085 [Vibrio lentus]